MKRRDFFRSMLGLPLLPFVPMPEPAKKRIKWQDACDIPVFRWSQVQSPDDWCPSIRDDFFKNYYYLEQRRYAGEFWGSPSPEWINAVIGNSDVLKGANHPKRKGRK